jgi:hypothetical protein
MNRAAHNKIVAFKMTMLLWLLAGFLLIRGTPGLGGRALIRQNWLHG